MADGLRHDQGTPDISLINNDKNYSVFPWQSGYDQMQMNYFHTPLRCNFQFEENFPDFWPGYQGVPRINKIYSAHPLAWKRLQIYHHDPQYYNTRKDQLEMEFLAPMFRRSDYYTTNGNPFGSLTFREKLSCLPPI